MFVLSVFLNDFGEDLTGKTTNIKLCWTDEDCIDPEKSNCILPKMPNTKGICSSIGDGETTGKSSSITTCTTDEDCTKPGKPTCYHFKKPGLKGVCTSIGVPQTESNCGDGKDNDFDNKIDCFDYDCNKKKAATFGINGCKFSICVCDYGNEKHCVDGFDNNGNAKVDCDDPYCAKTVAACKEKEDIPTKVIKGWSLIKGRSRSYSTLRR